MTREAALSYQSLQWRVLGASWREAIRWLAGDGDLEGFVSRGTNLEAGYINLSQVERWWKWHFFFGDQYIYIHICIYIYIYIGVFFSLANGKEVFFYFWQLFFFFRCCGWLLVIFQRPWCDLRCLSPPLACDHHFPDCPGWHSQNRNTLGKPTQHFCNFLEASKKEPWDDVHA